MTTTDAYLVLNLLPGIGPVRVARLLRRFGSPEAVLRQPAAALGSVTGCGAATAAVIAGWRQTIDLEREHRRIRETGVTVLTPADDGYPSPLRDMIDGPLVLYVMGQLTAADARAVAVVGSRQTTNYGIQSARRLSFQLAAAGMTVISGLARGIDTAAHEGALAAKGRTVAVIGSGLGHIYPPENQALAERIAACGAVVSEFPIDYPPDKQSFPLRNRIVAGWALGTLVVEAPGRSGALITANQALDYGRNVYAVPGPIDRPSSHGANRLIQEGARLVMDAADIVDDLSQLLPPRRGPGGPDRQPSQSAAAPAPAATTHRPDAAPSEAMVHSREQRQRRGPRRRVIRPAPATAPQPSDPGDVAPAPAELPLADRPAADPPATPAPAPPPLLTAAEQTLLDLLGSDERHIDELIQSSGLAGPVVLANLTRLEMKRLARQLPGKHFVRGPAAPPLEAP